MPIPKFFPGQAVYIAIAETGPMKCFRLQRVDVVEVVVTRQAQKNIDYIFTDRNSKTITVPESQIFTNTTQLKKWLETQ